MKSMITQEDDANVFGALEKPEDGINIHGLFIDAGRWDQENNLLVDALPGKIGLILQYTQLKKISVKKSENRFCSQQHMISVTTYFVLLNLTSSFLDIK